MAANPLHEILAAALRAGAGRPLATFYDEATGERVELSATTLDNWVAKTANLLRDTCGVIPGDVVGVALPPHWQTVVVVLAAWRLGTTVTLARPTPGGAGASAGAAAVTFGTAPAAVLADVPRLDGALGTGAEVVGLSLAPMGRGLDAVAAGVPRGVLDYAAEVLAHGDRCPAFSPGATPALLTDDGAPLAYGEVLSRLRTAADRVGIRAGDRVLVTYAVRADGPGNGDTLGTVGAIDSIDALAPLLAPMSVGASLLLVRDAAPDRLERIASSERATARWPAHM